MLKQSILELKKNWIQQSVECSSMHDMQIKASWYKTVDCWGRIELRYQGPS
jgi:hypothetical protein